MEAVPDISAWVCREAQVSAKQVDEVVLVGGCARIPRLQVSSAPSHCRLVDLTGTENVAANAEYSRKWHHLQNLIY